jgi:glutamate N-acetyltransferase/amino-acid N-acetyltransferase
MSNIFSPVQPIDGGITAPDGFLASAVASGLKPSGLDLALVLSEEIASAAGIFTTNLTVAPPVTISKTQLRNSGGQAKVIVVNSKCANACTGEVGMTAARETITTAARTIGCDPKHVLIASTGVIGMHLDSKKMSRGIRAAAPQLSRGAHTAAAEAIMTTDRHPKEAAIQVKTDTGNFKIGGMVKGAGMIDPLMATMLGFLTTDAIVDPVVLRRALTEVAADTFNSITVDGESSTNDTVFMLANGVSKVRIDETTYPIFLNALHNLCEGLAKDIVRGGEGATKLISIQVTGAETDTDAKHTARLIANSPLVKTALHGADPNWGRLIAVAGRSGVAFEPKHAQVKIGPVLLFSDETIFAEREAEAVDYLQRTELEISVDLGTGGHGQAVVWTCDLSEEYVHINADYRT